jgi:hypothetical protein
MCHTIVASQKKRHFHYAKMTTPNWNGWPEKQKTEKITREIELLERYFKEDVAVNIVWNASEISQEHGWVNGLVGVCYPEAKKEIEKRGYRIHISYDEGKFRPSEGGYPHMEVRAIKQDNKILYIQHVID